MTLPIGNMMKQFTLALPRSPWIAALPVSPEVAPSMVMDFCLEPFFKKYSKRLPSSCRATSLNAKVGP